MTVKKIGIVGARGHVGAELIKLVAAHPGFELAYVSSRELDGQRVAGDVFDAQQHAVTMLGTERNGLQDQ